MQKSYITDLLILFAEVFPGHHQTALQALPKIMGVTQDVAIVLETLRKQRNLNDYEGDPISDAVVSECLKQSKQLLAHTRQWLQQQHPEFLV